MKKTESIKQQLLWYVHKQDPLIIHVISEKHLFFKTFKPFNLFHRWFLKTTGQSTKGHLVIAQTDAFIGFILIFNVFFTDLFTAPYKVYLSINRVF